MTNTNQEDIEDYLCYETCCESSVDKLQAIIANKCNQARIDELELMVKEWGHAEYPMDNPRYGMDWEDWIDYRKATLKKGSE